jgi:hypothetical protein
LTMAQAPSGHPMVAKTVPSRGNPGAPCEKPPRHLAWTWRCGKNRRRSWSDCHKVLNCSNVSQTPAQRHRHDQHHGHNAEISEPLSNGRMLSHLSDLKSF